jgi:hypothetical protein
LIIEPWVTIFSAGVTTDDDTGEKQSTTDIFKGWPGDHVINPVRMGRELGRHCSNEKQSNKNNKTTPSTTRSNHRGDAERDRHAELYPMRMKAQHQQVAPPYR